ncbi:MAG: phenylalanine--tRNA ligase subunit beta [Deltaproteobacteria bacterium]|nr:phenylalanine--tRNA ligase subunit beta [Deltaproteobacteria bacterium]
MLLSLNWLREFVPYEGTAQALADRLTMLGLEVEEIADPFASLEKMVVGHVVERAAHPSSDHLSVCKVDIGTGEFLDIVCGAPNVAAGQTVPVAPVGTIMPNGLEIKKAKLRGQPSCGMICSERELGLGEGHDGIMVLDAGLRPGTPLCAALGLERVVLDVSITPNRADCLSVLGLAREVAAAFALPLTMPEISVAESGDPFQGFRIEPDPALCPLYQARLIRDVTIGPSPEWLRYRLLAVGQRPIGNIVDVTNYVMLELGQPLHAFDRDLLRGQRIRVGLAEDGMRLITLDGQERELTGRDLLIWDDERPVALAGVMGGANSEISATSSTVLLESAVFDPASIRKTARRLGLSSEASFRFERGVDQAGNTLAMNRAASLMAALSGGAVAPGVAKGEPRPFQRKVIGFSPVKATDLLGQDMPVDFCRQTLTRLGCAVEDQTLPWAVTAPSFRLDLEREVDLIEEVARVYGMDRIEAVLPTVNKNLADLDKIDPTFAFLNLIKDWGKGAGLAEAVNYSFVGTADLDRCGLPREGRVFICNPLSEEMNVLRTDLVPGLLNTLRQNISQDNVRVRVFEVAHVFSQDSSSDTQTREGNRLAILLHGGRFPGRHPYPDGRLGYADIKGLVEHLLLTLHLGCGEFGRGGEHAYLTPEIVVTVRGEAVGRVGMIREALAEDYLARAEVWYADLDVDALMRLHRAAFVTFAPIPKFPVVRRDMTLIASPELAVGTILDAVLALREPLLEEVFLADVYEPRQSGERNLTFRFVYRHAEKTLKDKEVDKVNNRIGQHLSSTLPVRFS